MSSFALSFGASLALLVVLVLAAVGISIFVYRHTVPEIDPRRRVVLVALRATALSLLLFLIFEPVLNLRSEETVAPRIAVLVDNSRSLTVRDGESERAAVVRALVASDAIGGLSGVGDVSPYLFAGRPSPLQALHPDSLTFAGGETDIALALQQAQRDLVEKNLRAVVLVTDGVVTNGRNPLHAAEALGLPVYVIGVGDSTEKKDLLVSRMLVNAIGYVESSIPVDVWLRSAGYGEETVRVTLSDGTSTVAGKEVRLAAGTEQQIQFQYVPKSDGVKKLTVAVTTLPGESTTKNNRATSFIKILKSKMKIVLVAGAPSPDVSFLEQAFRRDKNAEVVSYVQKQGASWYGNAPTQQSFADADAIVLAGYPLPQSGTEQLRFVREAIEKRAVPLLLVPSRDLDFAKLKSVLDAWLPFDVVQTRKEETQVFFELARDARLDPVVSSGIPTESWPKLPPLFRTESSLKARPGARTLATMRINTVAFNEPLLVSRSLNRSKVLAFTGYGLWRWQLADDVLGGALPELLVANSVRWLTTRDDNKRVRIRPVKEFFDSGDNIALAAQVYNESNEPVDDAEVTVTVKGPGGVRELALGPLGSGRYSGDFDGAREGEYSFTGSARREGAQLGTDEGRFTVGETALEYLDTRLNSTLLRQIASRSGGRYFSAADARALPVAISADPSFVPRLRDIKSDIQLWNLAWLLAAAVLLFAAEWYLRKQSGMV